MGPPTLLLLLLLLLACMLACTAREACRLLVIRHCWKDVCCQLQASEQPCCNETAVDLYGQLLLVSKWVSWSGCGKQFFTKTHITPCAVIDGLSVLLSQNRKAGVTCSGPNSGLQLDYLVQHACRICFTVLRLVSSHLPRRLTPGNCC